MLLRILAALAVLLGITLTAAPSTSTTALLAASLAVVATVALCLAGRRDLLLTAAHGTGPVDAVGADERHRGSFRRQTHPAAPGRPLPRAPQAA